MPFPIIRVFSSDLVSKVLLGATALLSIRFMADPSQYALLTLAVAAVTLTSQVLATSFNTIFVIAADKLDLADAPARFLAFQLVAVLLVGVAIAPFARSAGIVFPIGLILATGYCLSEFSKSQSQHALDFRRFTKIELTRSGLFLTGQVVLIALVGRHLMAWQVLSVQALSLWLVFVLFMRTRVPWRGIINVRSGFLVARTVLGSPFRVLFAQSALIALLMQTDVWMLKALASDEVVAAYGSAYRYYTLAMMVSTSLWSILLPVVQRATTADALERLFRKQLRIWAMLAPVVILIAIAAPWWIPMVDEGRYPDAVRSFQILSVSALLSVAFSPHMSVLLRFEDFAFTVGAAAVALLAAIALNALLIPHWGAVGAAWATLCAFLILNGSAFLRSRHHRQRLRVREAAP